MISLDLMKSSEVRKAGDRSKYQAMGLTLFTALHLIDQVKLGIDDRSNDSLAL